MNLDLKTKLLGLLCAAMDERETGPYILAMDGAECVEVHNLLKEVDDLLKAQWTLMGAPEELEIL